MKETYEHWTQDEIDTIKMAFCHMSRIELQSAVDEIKETDATTTEVFSLATEALQEKIQVANCFPI